jgi:hypothetical protein
MSSVERPRVSAYRPNAVIELSYEPRYSPVNSDDTPLTIRFDRCAMLDRMSVGECNA